MFNNYANHEKCLHYIGNSNKNPFCNSIVIVTICLLHIFRNTYKYINISTDTVLLQLYLLQIITNSND